jgi:hypothetical protein
MATGENSVNLGVCDYGKFVGYLKRVKELGSCSFTYFTHPGFGPEKYRQAIEIYVKMVADQGLEPRTHGL